MTITIDKILNPDWIGILVGIIALLLSIISIYKASEANSISDEANDKAERSNQIAKEALETAKKELELSIKDKMSSFKIKLISIDFNNDGDACKDMKEALSVGTADCNFEIENTSDKYANSVTFEKFDGKLEGDGLDIGPHKRGKLNYIIPLHKADYDTPELKLGKQSMYSLSKKMYWSNEVLNFSCLVTFTFYIQQDDSNSKYNWNLIIGYEGICKTSDYSLELSE
ncbi:hypothetical protein [Anaerococcus rubeinfantis]|uniref:hypothetical protein n=1 Tax=Anaerococcus rubeinfantis TaxID=1720199 RepID=UPI00073E2728|nr:hypothetical protein [Anaerococcus rubeinfantis]